MFYWFIPSVNMTERRFSDTLRELATLPNSTVPTYEPDHPDAPLFHTVDFPYDNIRVHGLPMHFDAYTGVHGDHRWLEIPPGLGYLQAYWRKTMVWAEPPFNEMFLTTIAVVADRMGAVFGAYTSENSVLEYSRFYDFFNEYQSYVFLINRDVEAIGRQRLEGMGTCRRSRTGMAILLDGPFAEETKQMLNEVWRNSFSNKEWMEQSSEEPSEIQVVSEAKGAVQNVSPPAPIGRGSDLDPWPNWMFFGPLEALKTVFVFYYPSANHRPDAFERFFASLWEREKNPNLQRLEPVPLTPREEADIVMEKGELLLYLARMDKDAHKEGAQNDLGIKTVDRVPGIEGLSNGDDPPNLMAAFITANELNKAEHVTQFLRILELFAASIGPVYGHGTSNTEEFHEWMEKGMVPSHGLWPINMHSGDTDLLATTQAFFENNAESWSLLATEGGHTFLVHNDPRVSREGLDHGSLAEHLRRLDEGAGRHG